MKFQYPSCLRKKYTYLFNKLQKLSNNCTKNNKHNIKMKILCLRFYRYWCSCWCTVCWPTRRRGIARSPVSCETKGARSPASATRSRKDRRLPYTPALVCENRRKNWVEVAILQGENSGSPTALSSRVSQRLFRFYTCGLRQYFFLYDKLKQMT